MNVGLPGDFQKDAASTFLFGRTFGCTRVSGAISSVSLLLDFDLSALIVNGKQGCGAVWVGGALQCAQHVPLYMNLSCV